MKQPTAGGGVLNQHHSGSSAVRPVCCNIQLFLPNNPALIRFIVEIEMDLHSLANSVAVYVLMNDDFLNEPVQRHSVQFLDVGIVLDDFQPAGTVLLLLGLLDQPFTVQSVWLFSRMRLKLSSLMRWAIMSS